MVSARRGFVVALVLLMLASGVSGQNPSFEAERNVAVSWPQDLDDPWLERADRLADILGIQVSYVIYVYEWYYTAALPITELWDRGEPKIESTFNETTGVLDILVTHPDGTIQSSNVSVAHRYETTPGGPALGDCVNGDCAWQEVPPGNRTILSANVVDLPIGVMFSVHNQMILEGPPGFLGAYGTGLDGLRNVSTTLGMGDGWDVDDLVVSPVPTRWSVLPEVATVDCPCERLRVDRSGEIAGANVFQAILTLDGEIVQVRSAPWIHTDRPILGEEEALAIAWGDLGVEGASFNHLTNLVFSRPHGVVWVISLGDAALDPPGYDHRYLIDAISGEIRSSAHPEAISTTPAPWLTGVALAFMVAALARARRSGT